MVQDIVLYHKMMTVYHTLSRLSKLWQAGACVVWSAPPDPNDPGV